MSEIIFTLPTALSGLWKQLAENEKAWVELIGVISGGRDPEVTSALVRALREVLDAG